MPLSRKPVGFAPPPIDEDTIIAVERVLRSGWITSGPELAAFEAEISDFIKVPMASCFSSWTSACELALRWFGVGPGDEVIIPAMTYAATANIVLHCGAIPVMVDVTLDDRVASLEALQSALTANTKVVMPVDLGGWPVDYQGICEWLCSEHVKRNFSAGFTKSARTCSSAFFSGCSSLFWGRIPGKARWKPCRHNRVQFPCGQKSYDRRRRCPRV